MFTFSLAVFLGHQIDVKEKELAQKLDLDKERKDRTVEEMSQEEMSTGHSFPECSRI